MYRSTFSLPCHKLEVSGQLHAPAALLSGRVRELLYPLDKRLGGPQCHIKFNLLSFICYHHETALITYLSEEHVFTFRAEK
jgi:hypothetical protein